MKKNLIVLLLIINSYLITAQVVLVTEGTVVNNTVTGTWNGVDIARDVKTTFTYRNNSIKSVNTGGYMLQAGDESPGATNNNLDGEVITGNSFNWAGVNSSSVITHGLFAGYNINSIVKYNYLNNVPYGIIFKSGTDAGVNMTFTSGGCAYNICRNGKFAGRVKGINGVRFYNNTFYSGDGGGWYLLLISGNMDRAISSPSTGTKIYNNIFYSTIQIPMIKIESGCLSNFECDYNVYWCSAGEPSFAIDGVTTTWAQWRARGYDAHSVIANPNFINTVDFVPATRMDYGTNLGAEWQTGLSTTAVWIVGTAPATADQNGTWQVGARINSIPGGCIPPAAPVSGLITQPTCTLPTGSIELKGLPATGTWTIKMMPGEVSTTGSGEVSIISGLTAGTYTFTVTDVSGCTSLSSSNIIINANQAVPEAPTVVNITQPTCTVASGSVVLNSLPSASTWTLRMIPGGTVTTGTGANTTITGLAAGTYTFTVTNISGCVSAPSATIIINSQPSTPAAPKAGTITQPTCSAPSGSVALSGLPATGNWSLLRSPGGITTPGTGASITITSLPAGSYTYKVTNASGCTSVSSTKIVINTPPSIPSAPMVGTIKQPTSSVATGSVVLSGLPSSGFWTLKRTPGSKTTTGTGTTKTITGLPAGTTYTFTVTSSSGCTSKPSANVIINAQPKSFTSKSYSANDSLAVNEDPDNSEPSKIKVYPNPVSCLLNIEYDMESYSNVKILNSSGMLIGKEIAVTPVQQLDFSVYEAGLYILEFIKPSGKTIRVKILKNK